jgi:putative PIN family toxin of toxin-antitoxin system
MSAQPQLLVIDTNIVLDLFVFEDLAVAPLREQLAQPASRWIATPAMREELARVLAYPQIARRLTARALPAAHVLAAFDQRSHTEPAAPKASCVCKDPDDQKFIDLAVAHRATLISKDHQVLRMARRLAPLGVLICRHWSVPVPVPAPVPESVPVAVPVSVLPVRPLTAARPPAEHAIFSSSSTRP